MSRRPPPPLRAHHLVQSSARGPEKAPFGFWSTNMTTKTKTPEPAPSKNGNGHPNAKPTETTGEAKNPAAASQTAARPSPVAQGFPTGWDDISIGHLVLATEGGGEGYWEAIVIGVEGDMVTMRWRDFHGYAKFTQNRTAVALLKPSVS